SGSSRHMPFANLNFIGFLPVSFSGGASSVDCMRLSVERASTGAVGLASGFPVLVWDGDCVQDFLDDFWMADAIASHFRNNTMAEDGRSQLLDVLRFYKSATSQKGCSLRSFHQ